MWGIVDLTVNVKAIYIISKEKSHGERNTCNHTGTSLYPMVHFKVNREPSLIQEGSLTLRGLYSLTHLDLLHIILS